jgi:hypothetical protein
MECLKFGTHEDCGNIGNCNGIVSIYRTPSPLKVCTHIKPGWKWNYYVVVVQQVNGSR